ncbi:MAG: hypothetical protein ACR2P8_10145 [Myxococcota bacterium]
MSQESTDSTRSEAQASEESFDREKDLANLRNVAGIHFAMVTGALTLWGAADLWAETSGWALAYAAAIANAVLAGVVVANTSHEWGHFAGARLSGAASPVMDKPVRYFFMFNFPFERTDRRQFAWMSWGGIVAPWLLVLLTLLLIPIDTVGRALLLAVFVTRAVQVSVFEVPVVLRARQGGDPREELGRQLVSGFGTSRYAGLAAGALVWLAV